MTSADSGAQGQFVVWHVMINCKHNLEISRLLSHADLHTIELFKSFHQVTHLLSNTTKIFLRWASGMFQNTLRIYIKTHLCSSRSSCCCRSDDCFESYTERKLRRKFAHFKELRRQQWDCVSGELASRLWRA